MSWGNGVEGKKRQSPGSPGGLCAAGWDFLYSRVMDASGRAAGSAGRSIPLCGGRAPKSDPVEGKGSKCRASWGARFQQKGFVQIGRGPWTPRMERKSWHPKPVVGEKR